MEEQVTYLGKNVAIENGCIATTENLTTEGRICTKLISTASVVIGVGAYFEGTILAHNIEIRGQFNGEALAKENVIIRSGSKVVGKLQAFSLCIESGASYSGESATISVEEFNKNATANKVYTKLVSVRNQSASLTQKLSAPDQDKPDVKK